MQRAGSLSAKSTTSSKELNDWTVVTGVTQRSEVAKTRDGLDTWNMKIKMTGSLHVEMNLSSVQQGRRAGKKT